MVARRLIIDNYRVRVIILISPFYPLALREGRARKAVLRGVLARPDLKVIFYGRKSIYKVTKMGLKSDQKVIFKFIFWQKSANSFKKKSKNVKKNFLSQTKNFKNILS